MAGVATAGRVLRDRVEDDLRHRRGLSYTVDTHLLQPQEDRRFLAVSADCRDGEEAVAARALWQALTRLADDGPTEEELAHERDGLAEYLADPRSEVEEARAAAVALATGLPALTRDELWQEALGLTAGAVQQAARQAREAALLGVPVGTEPGLSGLTPLPGWSAGAVPGEAFPRRRRGSEAPRYDDVPGLLRERARGVRESLTAAVRGEYDPPDSDALQQRLLRWERERPAGYRAANGVAALGQAAVAAALGTRVDGDWSSWTGALTALLAAGAAGSLWRTRAAAAAVRTASRA